MVYTLFGLCFALDSINLVQELKLNIVTMQDVPRAIRNDFMRIQASVFRNIIQAYHDSSDRQSLTRIRAWKLFTLLSRLLLHKLDQTGQSGNEELRHRVYLFDTGRWQELLDKTRSTTVGRNNHREIQDEELELKLKLEQAERLIKKGELSHAARLIKSVGLAPGNQDTLAQLTDPNLRPREQIQPLSNEILQYEPAASFRLDRGRFARNLRKARRGLSSGLAGNRNEHLKLSLENEDTLNDLGEIAQYFCDANLPNEISEAMHMCKMTAIRKSAHKIRGLNAGDSFRRLVAKTIAQQCEDEFRSATSPYNYGMACHSGMDAIIHLLRTASDSCPNKVITKIGGIGAFDHILRSSMLNQFRELPNASKALPFVRMFYGSPSKYIWTDQEGNNHEISQAEGGEQGDPLMPALFCLGMHPALQATQNTLRNDEILVAYLDDVYIFTDRDRVRPVYDILTENIRLHTGVETNKGKTECWSKVHSVAPVDVLQLNQTDLPPVWKSDMPSEFNGIEILGSPLGSLMYAERLATERLNEALKLTNSLQHLGSLQMRWLLLYYCAAPRMNHILRTTPPNLALTYATRHDQLMIETLAHSFQYQVDHLNEQTRLWQLQLPMRYGGCGIRSSARMSIAAYWGSWADTVALLRDRIPWFQQHFLHQLQYLESHQDENISHCLANLSECRNILSREGYDSMPTWQNLLENNLPPTVDMEDIERGEFTNGWQFCASDVREKYIHHALLETSTVTGQFRLRSCSGKHSSKWMTCIPTEKGSTLNDTHFRFAFSRRVGLPTDYQGNLCEGCEFPLDDYSLHRTTCNRTGRNHQRHKSILDAWIRVFREAGISIRTTGPHRNVERFLRDTFLRTGSSDMRRMDFVLSGLEGVFGGAPLFLDATCVSPHTGQGLARFNSHRHDGAVLLNAERRNRTRDYPDVENSSLAALLCLGCETYGRWSSQCIRLVSELARQKANGQNRILRNSIQSAYLTRWFGLLSTGVQRAVAETALFEYGGEFTSSNGTLNVPFLCDVLDSSMP